jgi:hypothetical protein
MYIHREHEFNKKICLFKKYLLNKLNTILNLIISLK